MRRPWPWHRDCQRSMSAGHRPRMDVARISLNRNMKVTETSYYGNIRALRQVWDPTWGDAVADSGRFAASWTRQWPSARNDELEKPDITPRPKDHQGCSMRYLQRALDLADDRLSARSSLLYLGDLAPWREQMPNLDWWTISIQRATGGCPPGVTTSGKRRVSDHAGVGSASSEERVGIFRAAVRD